MNTLDWIIDGAIMLTMLLLAVKVLTVRDIFLSAIFFMVFGLFMALAWVRLHAPDIALAEAAVGVGITGVLLLDAAALMRKDKMKFIPQGRSRTLFGLAAAALLCFILIQAVTELPKEPGGLTTVVENSMDQSGVKHPVTAVLLNFRGYDTWLELGVLFLAAMGALLFERRTDLTKVRVLPGADPVLRRAMAMLLPITVLVSGYLLWVGKYTSGGAFQAGVVLGSFLILMWLTGTKFLVILPGTLFRIILVIGFASFGLVAAVTSLGDYGLLEFPVDRAGDIILFIETCATLSIAWTMAALILGLQPHGDTPS